MTESFNLSKGDIAFHAACKYGHLDIAQWLRDNNKMDEKDIVLSENHEVLNTFTEYCCDKNFRDAKCVADSIRYC